MDEQYYILGGVRRAVARLTGGFADIAAIIEVDGRPDVAARLKLDQLHSPKHEIERDHRYIKWTEYPTCVLKRDPPAISVALLNSPGQTESIPLASVRLI